VSWKEAEIAAKRLHGDPRYCAIEKDFVYRRHAALLTGRTAVGDVQFHKDLLYIDA
jgi:hypothetical protein